MISAGDFGIPCYPSRESLGFWKWLQWWNWKQRIDTNGYEIWLYKPHVARKLKIIQKTLIN